MGTFYDLPSDYSSTYRAYKSFDAGLKKRNA